MDPHAFENLEFWTKMEVLIVHNQELWLLVGAMNEIMPSCDKYMVVEAMLPQVRIFCLVSL